MALPWSSMAQGIEQESTAGLERFDTPRVARVANSSRPEAREQAEKASRLEP